MKLNQKFFGQEHFEKGTPQREFCASLYKIKPSMQQYGFSDRDLVPDLPDDRSGIVQVKYNGMLTVILWDAEMERFMGWSRNGRRYFSLDVNREHPVTKIFDNDFLEYKDTAFIGETYAARLIREKAHMTEFNKSMSLIKNPKSSDEVNRIRLAVFDLAIRNRDDELERKGTPIERFKLLTNNFDFPTHSDSGVVHLADHLVYNDAIGKHQHEVQSFWNEYIKERGFEGLVLILDDGERYKLKYRDTLDVAIIAFRIPQRSTKIRPVCSECNTRFDSFWLKKLVRDDVIKAEDWFKDSVRLKEGTGTWDMYSKGLKSCPLCGGSIDYTDGPILGAKIALMTEKGEFVDIANGSQIPPSSPVLDIIEPLYENEGYLWVRPEVVIEVSYQDLYIDRMRPLLRFEEEKYRQVGEIKAVSLRPYGVTHRPDKDINSDDLRLEQISYFVGRSQRIRKLWEEEDEMRTTTLDEWI
ncbi:MAG: hypothetical protein ACFFE2_03640 [Candidatus Thorarchaeota archaeon]